MRKGNCWAFCSLAKTFASFPSSFFNRTLTKLRSRYSSSFSSQPKSSMLCKIDISTLHTQRFHLHPNAGICLRFRTGKNCPCHRNSRDGHCLCWRKNSDARTCQVMSGGLPKSTRAISCLSSPPNLSCRHQFLMVDQSTHSPSILSPSDYKPRACVRELWKQNRSLHASAPISSGSGLCWPCAGSTRARMEASSDVMRVSVVSLALAAAVQRQQPEPLKLSSSMLSWLWLWGQPLLARATPCSITFSFNIHIQKQFISSTLQAGSVAMLRVRPVSFMLAREKHQTTNSFCYFSSNQVTPKRLSV